ncbi:transposase [Enterobacter ludwigii]|uniref:transposase n=1 Tax=Enterobacter ludwigii TaxID=299767 RepID=UPI003F70ECB1
MGFWEIAGKIVKGAANALEEKANEMHAIKLRLESKSSEDLKRIIKSEGFFGSASNSEKKHCNENSQRTWRSIRISLWLEL